MKRILLLVGLVFSITQAYSQGCIAVRHMACASGRVNNGTSTMLDGHGNLQQDTGICTHINILWAQKNKLNELRKVQM